MSTKKETASVQVSRRRVIKTLTSAAGVALGASLAANPARGAKKKRLAAATTPPEKGVYKALGLILLYFSASNYFTTGGTTFKAATAIQQEFGFPASAITDIGKFINMVQNSASWALARHELTQFIQAQRPNPVYQGTQCPATADPIKYIIGLDN